MAEAFEAHFGKRNRPKRKDRTSDKKFARSDMSQSNDRGSGSTVSSFTYYACLGGLALITLASVSYIMEDPEVRAARLAEQAVLAEERAEAERQRLIAANRPKLTFDIGKCSKSYGFVEVTGDVTNNTTKSMDNLMVVGVFRDSNGSTIKSSSAMVEYQPLLAGQTSPYKVMTTNNPTIRSCNVAFKTMFGSQIIAERE